MNRLTTALRQHLRAAIEAFGGDLALPRPATPAARPAAAASEPAAARPEDDAATPARPAVAPTAAPRPTQPPLPARPAPTALELAARTQALAALKQQALACRRCGLHQTREQVVFGEGNPTPRVLFLGEAPGAKEDQTGRPFVGDAGQLLDRILQNAMGLARNEVYIANSLKCRPPANRDPAPDESAHCLPFLQQQIAILQPEVIVCLGRVAARSLLATERSVTQLRGQTLAYQGIPVVVTWHPAYLLREPGKKRETWEDIKRVNLLLGLPAVPPAGSS
jgi:DNA polymerase